MSKRFLSDAAAQPVKLFAGLIIGDIAAGEVKDLLVKRFGPVECESRALDFTFTDYYNSEMGRGLKRQFVVFERLIDPEDAGAIKKLTNRLEERFSAAGKRRINIDPGYMTPGKLVLLTTKDYYHRIYLGRGIYAEVTLYYKGNTFVPFEWTYPDYKYAGHVDFFNAVRKKYLLQLKQK